MDTTDLQPHPYADIFPAMLSVEYEALVADIHEHGQQEPIVLYEGQILDGRHRYQAIGDLQAAYPDTPFQLETRDFIGTPEQALSYVFSANLYRRHLNPTQRACVAVPIKKHLQESVKPGGDKRSEDYHSGNISSMVEERAPQARDIAGKIVSVSGRMVDKAERIQKEAPDLFERMTAGEMPVGAAENALAIRNGTQTRSQAVKAVAAEVVAQVGFENITEEALESMSVIVAPDATGGREREPFAALAVPYLEAARKVMGSAFHTPDADGLMQVWTGRVLVHPPRRLIDDWLNKLTKHLSAGDVCEAVVLTNNETESHWFQDFAAHCSAICFPGSRVRFLDPDGCPGVPLPGQAIFYAGQNVHAFVEHFGRFGVCLQVTE